MPNASDHGPGLSHPPRPGFGLAVGITGHRPPLLDGVVGERASTRLAEVLAMLAEAATQVHADEARFFAPGAAMLRW